MKCAYPKSYYYLLYSLFFINAFSFIFKLFFFESYGYLDNSFFFVKSDTFMDFYNTAFWSFDDGVFYEWKSVYTPFSLLIPKFILQSSCIGEISPFSMRACDNGQSIIYIVFAVVFGLLIISQALYIKGDYSSLILSALFFLFVLLSNPVLFLIERGNIISFAFLSLSLFFLFKDTLFKLLFLLIAVLIKQYLIVFALVLFFKKQFNTLFLFTLTLLSVSILISQLSDFVAPGLIFDNMFNFSSSESSYSLGVSWNNTSIIALEFFTKYLGDYAYIVNFLFFIYKLFLVILILTTIFILLSTKLSIDYHYLSFGFLLMLMALFKSVGGYSLIFIILYLPYFLKRNKFSYVVLIFLLFLNVDIPIYHISSGYQYSYLSNEYVNVDVFLTFETFFRPVLIFFLLFKYYIEMLKLYFKKVSDYECF